MLKAIRGFIPSKGRVAFDGVDLAGISENQRTKLIGYLPQSPPQSSRLLVWELATGALRMADSLLDTATLEHQIETSLKRFGLQEYALRPINELSGGKRQLLGVSVALARRSPLLLLDEPTSALDLRWQLEVLHAVRDVCRNTAVALVAIHDINLAFGLCDEVIILDKGSILDIGPPHDVINRDLLTQAYDIQARVEHLSDGRAVILADPPSENPI